MWSGPSGFRGTKAKRGGLGYKKKGRGARFDLKYRTHRATLAATDELGTEETALLQAVVALALYPNFAAPAASSPRLRGAAYLDRMGSKLDESPSFDLSRNRRPTPSV